MHLQQLNELVDAYDASPTRERCEELMQYIRRHSIDAYFPVWFRCSDLANRHQLQALYCDTFQLPVFTFDEYRRLTAILLNKGCTLPCIHQIYMYMLNPNARVNEAPVAIGS